MRLQLSVLFAARLSSLLACEGRTAFEGWSCRTGGVPDVRSACAPEPGQLVRPRRGNSVTPEVGRGRTYRQGKPGQLLSVTTEGR